MSHLNHPSQNAIKPWGPCYGHNHLGERFVRDMAGQWRPMQRINPDATLAQVFRAWVFERKEFIRRRSAKRA